MNNQKCILYARVSSVAQEESGYSLPAQEKLLTEYAENKEFKIEKTFSVSESASGQKQRQVFGEMLDLMKKKGIKIIICEKVDRLTRNLRDAVKINEWVNEDSEREVHFAKENWTLTKDSKSGERFLWNIRVSTAQFYTDNLSEEVKKGQKEKIAQGWLPTKPPIGYRTEGDKGRKIHLIDPVKAPLVKKMFEIYSSGNYSLLRLNKTMYELGLRTRGGNRMVKSRMADILQDPFYYGKVKWNGEIYDGKQEPLISKELYQAVQNVMHSKNTPKYRKHFFLFKSLISCDKCGGKITWETHKGYVYGHCNYYYKDCSQREWYREQDVDKQVALILSGFRIKQSGVFEWVRKALKDGHRDKKEFHSSAIGDMNSRLEQIQKRMDRLYDEKLDGKIPEDFYKRKLKEYSEEREVLLESIRNHTESDDRYFEFNNSLFELAQRAHEIYASIQDTDQKRSLLRLIFKDIRLIDGKVVYDHTEAFKLLVEAINLTSSKMRIPPNSSTENFEPSDFRSNKTKTGSQQADFVQLLRRQDSNL